MAGTAKKTDPALWDRVKNEVTDGDKGGEPGQWSARKAQLATHEYQERGGGYEGKKSADNHLSRWQDEEWGTRSGGKSGDTGERYLPKGAREALSDEEYERSSRRKRADTAKGRQHSPQPKDVAEKTARHRDGGLATRTVAELRAMARERNVSGRSGMRKHELVDALS